jgi:hypothetical protein
MTALVPVILSGGSGTRLWPLSREHYPKQLLALSGELTLLQEAAVRTDGMFVEIYRRHSLEVCEQRNTKCLYRRARAGEIASCAGFSSPCEAPEDAQLVIGTGTEPLDACAERIVGLLRERGVIPAPGAV